MLRKISLILYTILLLQLPQAIKTAAPLTKIHPGDICPEKVASKTCSSNCNTYFFDCRYYHETPS